jgi:hypothetical protein
MEPGKGAVVHAKAWPEDQGEGEVAAARGCSDAG